MGYSANLVITIITTSQPYFHGDKTFYAHEFDIFDIKQDATDEYSAVFKSSSVRFENLTGTALEDEIINAINEALSNRNQQPVAANVQIAY